MRGRQRPWVVSHRLLDPRRHPLLLVRNLPQMPVGRVQGLLLGMWRVLQLGL
jgi:hypothetical protein